MWWYTLLEIIVAVFLIAIVSFIIYTRWEYGTLEKLGIPVIKPKFILGSHPFIHKQIVHEEDVVNFKKYGSIWGSYFGRTPQVFICDPELLRRIFVKDFEYFHDRRDSLGDAFYDELPDALHGAKWKFVRSLLTPTFTTGKLKIMSDHLQISIADFLEQMKRRSATSGTKFNVKELYSALTMDVFARAAFGTKINCLDDPNNPFLKNAKTLMGGDLEFNFFIMLIMFNPIILKLVPLADQNAINFFKNVLRDMIRTRRESNGEKVNDFLDIIVDAESKLETEEFKNLNITELTILAQAVGFMVAGFDTTALTMSLLSYNLAKYPEKQEAVHEEIDAMWAKHKGRIDHDTIGDFPYLTACINETLRLYPPLFRMERSCAKDWSYENIRIKKGTLVLAPAWPLHRNPMYFEDPDEFIPERFLDKDIILPFTFIPFGGGPRNCIGFRFAMEQMKLAMIQILKEYSVSTNSETKLKFKPGIVFLIQHEPIMLNFEPRTK